MRKFAVFGGFLGAGKTTTMMALTRYCSAHFCKAAMISNDLGAGVTLADHKQAQLGGCEAAQITDECICFCRDVLAERLERFYSDGCGLVVSDIPGFGVGALEHVYFGLEDDAPGRFELAPFTVITEPRCVELLRSGSGGDESFILDAQLREAELIVLNKCELPEPETLGAELEWLSRAYPGAKTLAISAREGRGLDELCRALLDGRASMRRPDIDYGGEGLQRAMGRLSEYYLQYRAVVCCNDFDGSEYLLRIAERIGAAVRDAGFEIPHLKLLAWGPDGDYGKVDLLGAERPAELTRRFERPCTDVAVIINTSAFCPDGRLNRLIGEAVGEASGQYGLELNIFRKDCFAMGG